MCGYSPDTLDALLADHDTLANVDATIGTIRALGLDPRPAVIRQQAALNEVEPDRAELLVALIGRRLSSMEGAL
ncbi:hypothetical protein [Bosea sp. (in: a-proteobacteria)]|uniref:hypothetical protein n=1 Tax=Bosea sp. (in: a-proteobacteria) TaxID=1871050 RepID=UPI0025BE7068|nr:hypothetical protein [Bosea sp. (in: a-proteobacteria)]MBR3190436.1 hypothetical protein [Bosea sp. (in: a-proteobacteria)]